MSFAYFFVSTINIGVYLYTPELYPTRTRALGVGTATAWLRFASIIGPIAVGSMIAGGLRRCSCGSAWWPRSPRSLPLLSRSRRKGRVLEEVSP